MSGGCVAPRYGAPDFGGEAVGVELGFFHDRRHMPTELRAIVGVMSLAVTTSIGMRAVSGCGAGSASAAPIVAGGICSRFRLVGLNERLALSPRRSRW
jgi:hypothetical protein